MKGLESIKIRLGDNNLVEVINPTIYPLVGRGAKTAIFQTSLERCAKMYISSNDLESEVAALKALEHLSFVPKLHEIHTNYIIIDFYSGISLQEYLHANNELTDDIFLQMLNMIRELQNANCTNLDTKLDSFIVTNSGVLKRIDYMDSFRITKKKPLNMLKELQKIGYLNPFLEELRIRDSKLYSEWNQYSITDQIASHDNSAEQSDVLIQQVVKAVKEVSEKVVRSAVKEISEQQIKQVIKETLEQVIREVKRDVYQEVTKSVTKDVLDKVREQKQDKNSSYWRKER